MPGGDRTGPRGMGSMTGRGAGFCAGYGVPGYTNPRYGQGRSLGAYGGGGRRNRFFATGVPGRRWFAGDTLSGWAPFSEQPEPSRSEWEALKGQARYLEDCLNELKAHMETLAPEGKTD